MNIAHLIKAAAVTALLAAGTAQAANTNLIKNGSFEHLGAGVADLTSGNWSIYASLPGWTGGANGIEVRDNVAGTAFAGNNFVELDTYANSSMSQTVQTVAGQTYKLTFEYESRPDVSAASQGLSVSFGGAALGTVDTTTTSQWTKATYSFVGTGAAETLTFAATGTSDSLGTSLDKVRLVAAVPEPETYGMLLAGLGLIGFVARRRKAAR